MVTALDQTLPAIPRPSRIAVIAETAAALFWLAGTVLSPVWLGSNFPFVWAVHAVLFGLALALYAASGIGSARAWPVPFRRLRVPLAAFAVALVWAALQTIPGVPDVVRAPVWGEASAALGRPLAGAISVDPEAGRMALLWAATAATVFIFAVQLGRAPDRARIITYVVAVAGGLIALYGLAVYFDGNKSVVWAPKHAYRDALTATFVNKNNYGAFAGLGVICTFGLLLARLPHGAPYRTRRRRWSLLVRGASVLLLGAALAGQTAALLLAASRAATAATVLGILVVLLLWVMRVPAWRRPLLVAFGLAALGILVFASSWSELLTSRLPNVDQDLGSRLAVAARTLAAIRAAPWTGYGLGAFQQAFSAFRDSSVSTQGRWEYAHNDWLEALMALGIPAGLMLWLVFGWIGYRCVSGALHRGRDAIYPAVGAGVCALTFAHTLVDFTMQIQGYAFPFLAIVGVGVAQSWSSRSAPRKSGQAPSAPPKRDH